MRLQPVYVTLLSLSSAIAWAGPALASQRIAVHAGPLSAQVAPLQAQLTGVTVRGHEILTAPAELYLEVDGQTPVRWGPAFQGFSATVQAGEIQMQGTHPKLPLRLDVQWRGGKDLECRARLVSEVRPRATAHLELRLPVARQTLHVLAPSGDDRHACDFSSHLAFAFRGRGRNLVMPAVVLYRPDQDWGLSVLADFTIPTRGFEVVLDEKRPAVLVRRVDIRLEPGRPVEVSLILAGHEGDWRPGLGHVLARYPESFVVEDTRLPKLHGAFVCSGGTPDAKAVAAWKAQGVQTVEVHGTIPFYGQHLPLGDKWTIFADDRWHRLREQPDLGKPDDDASWQTILQYVNRKVPPSISVPEVRDYIRRLHAQGIYAVMYFNPTEAWKPWIKANYPEALVKTAAGEPIPVWYESYLVCPNPDSPWGQHLLDEFSKMMDLYPEADGFFMDQSCYDNLNHAQDDGWSIAQGRTGYRMGWAINQISQRCRALAKPRGKFMWWNGPYNVNIARYAEGMMAEAGNEAQVRTIYYLTMGGRACCTLSQKGEEVFQNCAAYGLYPTAMGTAELARLAARYRPIIDLFRGKQWIFHARALDLPPGTKGNVYRLPDDGVLAVAVTAGRSVDGAKFDLDLPLVVRLPDAAEFRAACFLSPDLLGKRRLPIQRQGEEIRVVIPRHRSVSAVLLTKTESPGTIEAPFETLVGRTADAKPALRKTADVQNQHVEFYVDRPLSVEMVLPPQAIPEGVPGAIGLCVFNAAGPREVRVSLSGRGFRAEPAEQVVRLDHRSRRELSIRVVPSVPGPAELTATVEADADRCEARGRLEVHATRASADDLRRVQSGVLALELAGSDGGKYKDKPVFLNGVRLDVLPSQGDRWGPAELALSPAVLATLKEINEVRIENKPGDAFKVRNFQLRLRCADGQWIVSHLNSQAYTSCGWEFAEGQVFRLHEPLVGIEVRIPPR